MRLAQSVKNPLIALYERHQDIYALTELQCVLKFVESGHKLFKNDDFSTFLNSLLVSISPNGIDIEEQMLL